MLTSPARADELPLAELGLSQELVTGEAVVLDLRTASFASRSVAYALDFMLLVFVLFAAMMLLVPFITVLDEAAAAAIMLSAGVGIMVGIPVAVEALTRGRSVGKLAMGLRVVRDDGGPVRFRQSLVRGLVAVMEIYISWGTLALITSLVNRRGKRLGDLLAGTQVIKERTSGHALPLPVMPPELATWALGADIARIPDDLAMAARAFLGRTDAFHPESRQRLAHSLADQIARFTAPPPPPGTFPERYLAAVLVERSRRHLERMHAEAHARAARHRQRALASPLAAVSTRLIGE